MQLVARALHDHRGGRDRQLLLARHRLELAGRLHQDRAQVGGARAERAARVRAREQEQVGDQPAHALGGAQGGGRHLALVVLELVGQQLEVGQHAGQRRAQLVRGVGHELALARQGRLGLRPRGVQRGQHRVQGPGQLGDLVLARRLGNAPAGVAGALDLAGGGREVGDRVHRAARHGEAGQQRQPRSAQDAEQQEPPDAGRRALHSGERAGVLDDRGLGQQRGAQARHHAVVAHLGDVEARRAQVGRVGRLAHHLAAQAEHPDHGVLAAGVGLEVRRGAADLAVGLEADPDPVLEVGGGVAHLRAEVGADAARGQRAHQHREAEQDDQRQQRRAARQPPADRQAAKRGGRTPRRGSCEGGEARHRLPVSVGGWRRTPRSCW